MAPIGFLTGIGAGAASALEALIGKAVLNNKTHPVVLGIGWHTVGFFSLISILLFRGQELNVLIKPDLLTNPNVIGWIGLNAAAFLCYLIALGALELSCAIPFLSFVPLTAGLVEFLVFGRSIPVLAIPGIVLVCIGGYFVGCYKNGKIQYKKPFVLFANNPAGLIIIGAVVSWSFSINMANNALDALPFLQSVTLMQAGLALFFIFCSLVWAVFDRTILDIHLKAISGAVLVGVISCLTVLLHFATVDYLISSYAAGLKRVNVVFSYVFGILFLNEASSRSHAISIFIIVLGVLLIVIA